MRIRLSALALIACASIGIGIASGTVATVQAASGDWSVPVLLYQGTDQITDPAIAIGPEGAINVFWSATRVSSNSDSSANLIYYTRLDGKKWSTPADVVAAPSAEEPTAAIDGTGVIHLFWRDGTTFFRSQAPATRATSAIAWEQPLPISATFGSMDLVADAQGNLHLVYPGISRSAVYYQVSHDEGRTWSFPVTIAIESGVSALPNFTRVAVGPDGTIHVVWTEFQLPNAWPPVGIYYSHSTDGGRSWSTPLQIAGEGFTQINVAAGPNKQVVVAWNGMSGVQGRYSRFSKDGGDTWSAASVLLAPTNSVGGSAGPPGLAIDSRGVAHVLFVTGARVWYSQWGGQSWSTPEVVHAGKEEGFPPGDQPVDDKTRQIEQPVMAMGPGNQLHVVFWDLRPSAHLTYIWYTTKSTGVSDTPNLPVPTAHSAPANRTPTVQMDSKSPPTPTRTIQSEPPRRAISPPDPRWTIIAGLAPAAGIIVASVLFGIFRLRQ